MGQYGRPPLATAGFLVEILMLKGRKWLILPTPPLFETPARGTPSEFLDETYTAQTRRMGQLYGDNCVILASTPNVTDGRTDGIAMAYTRYSIYAVACKKSVPMDHDANNATPNLAFINGWGLVQELPKQRALMGLLSDAKFSRDR